MQSSRASRQSAKQNSDVFRPSWNCPRVGVASSGKARLPMVVDSLKDVIQKDGGIAFGMCENGNSIRTRSRNNDELSAWSCAEHVSGAERQNFPLIAPLHLRESRSPLRSAQVGFRPAPLRSRSAHMLWSCVSMTFRAKTALLEH